MLLGSTFSLHTGVNDAKEMVGKQDNLEGLDRIAEVNFPVGGRVFVGANCTRKELHSRDLFVASESVLESSGNRYRKP